jgi:hypothetical protein
LRVDVSRGLISTNRAELRTQPTYSLTMRHGSLAGGLVWLAVGLGIVLAGCGSGRSSTNAAGDGSGASATTRQSSPTGAATSVAAPGPQAPTSAASSEGGEHGTLQTFGRAATAAQRSQIVAAVEGYAGAVLAGDGAGACALLSDEAKLTIAQAMARVVSGKRESCDAFLSQRSRDRSARTLGELQGLRVTDVRVKGELAIVFVASAETPYGLMTVRRERGAWKVKQREITMLERPAPAGG